MPSANDTLQKAEELLDIVIARARGEGGDPARYMALRAALTAEPGVGDLLPKFVRKCRNLDMFWRFIQPKFSSYRERGDFLQAEFQPLFDHLEGRPLPSDPEITAHLERLDPEGVRVRWERARARIETEPEGAITLARTLLESVCKIILEESGHPADEGEDLPPLYKQTARALQLSPSQHTEQVFKKILTGCSSVVEGLGEMRNRLSDAHGRTRSGARPADRHARLAVNLAGAMSLFLVETWQARQKERAAQAGGGPTAASSPSS